MTIEYNESQKKFNAKIGDTVHVFRTATDYESGWGTFWDYKMDEAVGKKGKVIDIKNSIGIHIKIHGIVVNYWYPYFVLRLVR